jgi:hypothetical protein
MDVEMGREYSKNRRKEECRQGSVRKPERKRPLGTLIRRWEDTIKMDLREIHCDGMDWIHLAQERNQWSVPVNTAMNIQVR